MIATGCTILSHRVCELHGIIWMGWMYFTTENCEKTMVLPVIAVPITNDVSEDSMKVTEVMKVTLLNCESGEGEALDTVTHESNGWVTFTTKRGRQITPPGRYDPATGKMVTWNVTAAEVDVERSRGLGDVYKRQDHNCCNQSQFVHQDIQCWGWSGWWV